MDNHPMPNEEERARCISRRHALAAGTAIVGAAATSGLAWGLTSYASSRSDAWTKPPINHLNAGANLFKPGDRPCDDVVATCTEVNTSYTRGKSRSYWGCDVGLDYLGDDQRDWPLRSHAFGNNTFSRIEASSNAWTDRWKDPITGQTLANNAGGCGRSGYGAHHLVSFAMWDTSAFGGILPTSIGTWNLHNVSGLTWGTYGKYMSADYAGGAVPPDSTCAFAGASAFARITCFSVETETSGSDYRLHYCLYCFLNFTDIGISVSRAFDNYAGLSFAWATAAGIRCEVSQTGLERVAEILIDNINRGFAHREIDTTRIAELVKRVETRDITVPEALELALEGFSPRSWYSTAYVAARALTRALLLRDPTSKETLSLAVTINTKGCATAARDLLESEDAAGALGYPIAFDTFSCAIAEPDAAENTHSIEVDDTGFGQTGRVYNYGTYTGQLSPAGNGWDVVGGLQATVTVPDNGSGLWFPLTFEVVPASYPVPLATDVTVTYKRDAIAAQRLGLESTCFSQTVASDILFEPPEEARTSGVRPGCDSWRGWYLDESCTIAFEPRELTEDLTLYCINEVIATWDLTNNATSLERRLEGNLYSDAQLSVTIRPADLLPSDHHANWGSSYAAPSLPALWWRSSTGIQSSPGTPYRDAAAITPFEDEVTLLRSMTFFADWRASTYDGVSAS